MPTWRILTRSLWRRQGSVVSREALATVGRTLTLAALLPALPWPAMSALLANGFFPQGPAPTGGAPPVPPSGRLPPRRSNVREREGPDVSREGVGSPGGTDGHDSVTSILSSPLRGLSIPETSNGNYPADAGTPKGIGALVGDQGTGPADHSRIEQAARGPETQGEGNSPGSVEEGLGHVDPTWWARYSYVEAALRERGTSLAAEVQRCPPGSRACVLKGLVQALPGEALCAPLVRYPGVLWGPTQGQGAEPWTLLMDGALRYGCEAAETARDVHVKYQAVCLIEACLARICTFLEVRALPPAPLLPPFLLALLRPFIIDMQSRVFSSTGSMTNLCLAVTNRVCAACVMRR